MLWLIGVGFAAGLAAPPSGGPPSPAPERAAGVFEYATGQPALDRLQTLVRDTLEANRKDFRGRTGAVRGFGAGASYPQIWIRDSATLVAVTRYLYPREVLTSWIEEHLADQRADGSVNDWVAAGAPERFTADAPQAIAVFRGPGLVVSADRNTSEADQESSAVLAAEAAFRATADRAWLRRPVAGTPLLARLDRALEFLLARRRDPASGLVVSAFTADWGDVTPAWGDQRAIYLDETTPLVGSLYASSLASGAARALSRLHAAAGDAAGAARWQAEGGALSAAVDGRLWDEARGFYRVHALVRWPGKARPPSEEDRFALGGNATAVLAGGAGGARARRIVAAAVARRRAYGMSTVSGVLLPPYPAGFFLHPILREPFTYQNGGEWDWFGGRLVLAAFEHGDSDVARRELARIAEQAVRNGGLHEWATRDGHGRGSPAYAGAAGALGTAVLCGLFGIDLGPDGLDLRVRLGAESGRVRVAEPATGRRVAYEYAYEAGRRRARLRLDSNVGGTGTLEVRLPAGLTGGRALVDGRPAAAEVRRVGKDRYLRLRTGWTIRSVDIQLR